MSEIPELKRGNSKYWSVDYEYEGNFRVIVATQWPNLEGFDLTINDNPPLSIHDSDLDALRLCLDAVNTDACTIEERNERVSQNPDGVQAGSCHEQQDAD